MDDKHIERTITFLERQLGARGPEKSLTARVARTWLRVLTKEMKTRKDSGVWFGSDRQ